MFPSETYRKLCIENAGRLREEWEPIEGDFAVTWHFRDLVLIVRSKAGYIDFMPLENEHHYRHVKGVSSSEKRYLIPLFQPRQIIEMLKERGFVLELTIYLSGETGITVYQRCVDFYHGDDTYRCEKCRSYVRYDYKARQCIQVGQHDKHGEPCPHLIEAEGPNPACALLRVWLEVVKE